MYLSSVQHGQNNYDRRIKYDPCRGGFFEKTGSSAHRSYNRSYDGYFDSGSNRKSDKPVAARVFNDRNPDLSIQDRQSNYGHRTGYNQRSNYNHGIPSGRESTTKFSATSPGIHGQGDSALTALNRALSHLNDPSAVSNPRSAYANGISVLSAAVEDRGLPSGDRRLLNRVKQELKTADGVEAKSLRDPNAKTYRDIVRDVQSTYEKRK